MSESSTPNSDAFEPEATLSPEDAERVDRWLADRARGDQPPAGDPVAGLMDLLGTPDASLDEHADDLVAATLVRITRTGQDFAGDEVEPVLHPVSADAVDAWVAAGGDTSRTPESLRSHTARLEAIGVGLRAGAVSAADELADRTLARIADAERGPIPFEPAAPSRSSFRLIDLISAAAMLLVAASVVWPVVAQARGASQRTVCAANLMDTGRAFNAYTSSHAGSLPVATAGFASPAWWTSPRQAQPTPQKQPWWQVGSREQPANSAHLFMLVRLQYASIDDLACPGNPSAPRKLLDPQAVDWSSLDEISYSYQLSAGPPDPIWLRKNTSILLADSSPVVRRAVRGERVDPFANSANHRGRGQHVLRVDGSAVWLTDPVMATGDNLWLPRPLEQAIADKLQLKGWEQPAGPDDAFVGP
ncbi:MAG: hypothetical protein AAF138_08990 [Planctomycetota bacterium]